MTSHAFSLAMLALCLAGEAEAQTATQQPPPNGGSRVVVTGRRPKVQTLIDRKVYTVSGDLQTVTGSAADILNELPSVNVDPDGGVTLRGDPNVTVLVDGRPQAGLSGAAQGLSLLQFPASDIDRIEVLNNPPAEYKASGSGGVINIITRKRSQAGLSGAVRAGVGDHGRYNLSVSASYNSGPLHLSGGAGVRQDQRDRITTDHRSEIDPASGAPIAGSERIEEIFHRRTPSMNGKIDYDLTNRETIGASISYLALNGHRFFDQVDASGPLAAPVTSIADRHSDGHEVHVEAGGDIHFVQKLDHPDETLTLELRRSTVVEDERYDYADASPLPPASVALADLHLGLKLTETEVSADYDWALVNDREVKAGYTLTVDDNAFDNKGDNIDPLTRIPTVDLNDTNSFRYQQTIHAAYGEYEGGLGQWRLQAGLRIEDASAKWLLLTGDIPGRRHDFGLYPSLHLGRPSGANGKWMIDVSRRITRPEPEQLNPFSDHQDTHNLRAGNPDLAPQDTWKYELGYLYSAPERTFGLTAYYRTDRDSVTDVVVPVAPNVVLDTKANLPNSQAGGLEFSAAGRLARSLSYNVDGNLHYAQIDARPLGATGLRSTIGVDLKASFDWRPTPADTVQVSFSRQDKRLTPQGDISAIDLINIGYKHTFTTNVSLVATLSDVLNGQRFIRVVSTPALSDRYQRFQRGDIALVSLVYGFGLPQKGKGEFQYDQSGGG